MLDGEWRGRWRGYIRSGPLASTVLAMMEEPDLDYTFRLSGVLGRGMAGDLPDGTTRPMIQLSLRGDWAQRPGVPEAIPVIMFGDHAELLIEVLQRQLAEAQRLCEGTGSQS